MLPVVDSAYCIWIMRFYVCWTFVIFCMILSFAFWLKYESCGKRKFSYQKDLKWLWYFLPLSINIIKPHFQFQRKVENVAYSRLCSSAQPKSMTKTKSSLKHLNETFGPVLTVLGTPQFSTLWHSTNIIID